MFIPRVYQKYFNFFKIISTRRKKQFLKLLIISFISAFIEILNISIIVPYLDLMAGNQYSNYKSFSIPFLSGLIYENNFILFFSFFLILSVLISMILRLFTLSLQFKLSTSIASDLGLEIFSKSLKNPYDWHLDINSTILKGYITKDVDNLSEFIKGITFICVNSILIILIAGYLISTYPIRTIILLFIIASIYLIIFILIKYSLKRDGQVYSKKYQETLQIAEETYNNIEVIKISNSFDHFIKKFSDPNKKFRRMSANINIKSQAPRYIIESFIVVLIISSSIFIYLTGNDIKSEFVFLGTIGLGSLKILTPIQQLFNGISSIQAYKVSFLKVFNFLSIKEKEIKKRKKKFYMEKDIIFEFSKVYFKFKSEHSFILKNINLKIKEGEKIGIVGHSGSGKSTFAKLLVGLLIPDKGVLIHENKDIFQNKGNLQSWQKKISYFPQDIFLNDDDILTNIAYGIEKESINIKEVIRTTKLSEIHEFIYSLPLKYSNKIGEKGFKLSGGQRQRIGISRGLYKKPKVLVFDESLNSLDSKIEIKIINNIMNNFKKETIFLISHRLSTLKNFDRIIVFNKGFIEDIGNYNDLKRRNKIFISLLNS